jgi:putative transposase
MPRNPRFAPGGLAYHVHNRAFGKTKLFKDAEDYETFEQVLAEAAAREPTLRICAYCLMPDHFHLVVLPRSDGQLSRFMQWVTMTHAQRWRTRRGTAPGHIYQSRFRSFPIQEDLHFPSVCRYVETNAVRKKLAKRADRWRWSSLWARASKSGPMKTVLSKWPVKMPNDWATRISGPQEAQELAALRVSLDRGRPYGDEAWVRKTAKRLGAESTLRPIGRPRIHKIVKKKS